LAIEVDEDEDERWQSKDAPEELACCCAGGATEHVAKPLGTTRHVVMDVVGLQGGKAGMEERVGRWTTVRALSWMWSHARTAAGGTHPPVP